MTVTVLISRSAAEMKNHRLTPGDFKAQMLVNGLPKGAQLIKPGCRDLGAAEIQAKQAVRELLSGSLLTIDRLEIEFKIDPSAEKGSA